MSKKSPPRDQFDAGTAGRSLPKQHPAVAETKEDLALLGVPIDGIDVDDDEPLLMPELARRRR